MLSSKRSSRRRFLKAGTSASAVAVAGVVAGGAALGQSPPRPPAKWQREADIVVIGAGATGLTSSIAARESGASVILIEAQTDIGGHAILSGGNMPLGGGTSRQQKYGVVDSADLLFQDLTDWSIVEPNGFPDYRYNDREIIRAFADHSAITFEWLLAHGVVFVDQAPDSFGGLSVGNSALRMTHTAAMNWPLVQTGQAVQPDVQAETSSGIGLMRPLEAAARSAGVQILLEHRMRAIYRHPADAGGVLGVAVDNRGAARDIRARKAVIVATGGSAGNVNFRRMFDPRLTEEYSLVGMPWSDSDASGELASMAIGASLWGLYNQSAEFGYNLCKPGYVGCRYGYAHLQWLPGSRVFGRAGASGLYVSDWQNLILVNMLGNRFYDETGGQFTANNYRSVTPYTPDRYTNAANMTYHPNNFLNAALAGIGDGRNGGGAIWAIFDADAVTREGWDLRPPNIDSSGGLFFSANTAAELATKIVMNHQRTPMPPQNLATTIARYNSFVNSGRDDDFGKAAPRYRLAKPPFFAAWAAPMVHDTRAGLRINARCQVIDMNGRPIPRLYCGGESAGGFSQHGLARATCQGYIAGKAAAAESFS
jgi:succinate dehydrogenase/fumarate reductase flavoprotein subunit